MGEIHFNITLHVPEAISTIGNACAGKVEQLVNACTDIKNRINGSNIKNLNQPIKTKARTVKEAIQDKIGTIKGFFDKSPDLGNIKENLPGIDKNEKLLSSKALMDAVIQIHKDKTPFKTKGEYAQALYKKLDDVLIHSKEEFDAVDGIQKALKNLENNTDAFVAPHSKASEIADKAIDKGKKIIGDIATKIKDTADNVKIFFDKSPTIGEICNKIGIEHETFKHYLEDFQKFLLANLKDCYDDDASDKIALLKDVLDDFEAYKHNKNTSVNNEELNTFLNEIKQQIEELTPEAQKEEKLYKELLLIKPTKSERALAISKLYGGKEISSGDIKLTIDGNPVTIQTKNTPQKLLSGFPDLDDFPGAKDLKQYSSEFQGGKTHHASNLWKQDISFDDKKLSFIRCGNTRGGNQPAKEILANALTLQYTQETIFKATNKDNPLTLNFSNIQLMTPGKLADKNMPSAQMKIFEKLANENENQPIELNYQGETVYVKLEPPLLFNFPTNAQGLCKIFKPFVNFDETNKRNDDSFQRLFGDYQNFGKGTSPIPKGFDNHYFYANKPDSLVAKKLALIQQCSLLVSENKNVSIDGLIDKCSNKEGKALLKQLKLQTQQEDEPKGDKLITELNNLEKQIQSLADQIIDIYTTDKRGLEKNPTALPTRVALLTNLLGYATSYGCKSGKDRTGLMSMELENLTAKVLTDNKPYDAYNLSTEEKQNLQSIYKAGCSIEIAKVNTGDVQNKLKIRHFGIFTSDKERFGIDLSKDYDKNLEILK